MRGATDDYDRHKKAAVFQLTRPMRGATALALPPWERFHISTHTPHAGRDLAAMYLELTPDISTHTPHAGRDHAWRYPAFFVVISTHTPHAGRDIARYDQVNPPDISTHTPHAGRDTVSGDIRCTDSDFNSHAPCGARP